MENQARIIGYVTVIAILTSLLYIAWMLGRDIFLGANYVQVRFSNVGTLMVDDPVKLNGVDIGRVNKIESRDGAALVTLELFRRIRIPADSRFFNHNHSLMGARMVLLVSGDSPQSLDQAKIQEGIVNAGVAESIHKVEQLLEAVLDYRKLADYLDGGTDSTLSLQALLEEKVYPLLERYAEFAGEFSQFHSSLNQELTTLTLASNDMRELGASMNQNGDSLLVRTGHTLNQLSVMLTHSAAMLEMLEKKIKILNDTSSLANKLLLQKEIYNQTMALNENLQSLLRVLKQEGLQDVIHFWRNVHFKKRKDPR